MTRPRLVTAFTRLLGDISWLVLIGAADQDLLSRESIPRAIDIGL